ncbi:hypothetical protein Vretifemale_13985, partial [Volvox reticuliferus]
DGGGRGGGGGGSGRHGTAALPVPASLAGVEVAAPLPSPLLPDGTYDNELRVATSARLPSGPCGVMLLDGVTAAKERCGSWRNEKREDGVVVPTPPPPTTVLTFSSLGPLSRMRAAPSTLVTDVGVTSVPCCASTPGCDVRRPGRCRSKDTKLEPDSAECDVPSMVAATP